MEIAEGIDREREKQLEQIRENIRRNATALEQQIDRDKVLQERDQQLGERIAEFIKAMDDVQAALFEVDKRLVRFEERERRIEEELFRRQGRMGYPPFPPSHAEQKPQ